MSLERMKNDAIYAAIVEARVKLLFEWPFFGSLALRMDVVDATKWCPTAATDGRFLYYNRDFIKKLTDQELVFLIGHELLHAVYDHVARRGNRDPLIWNMAIDYIVNYTLVKEKIGEMINGGLYSDKFTDEMTSDEVYNILEKNSVKIQIPLDMHLDSKQDKDNDKNCKSSGNNKGDNNSKKSKDGMNNRKTKQVGGNTATLSVVGEDGPPELTEEDLEQIRNNIKNSIIQTAQCVGAGKIPLGIRRLIDELTESKIDWKTLLETHIQSAIKDDFSFRRFSRKSWSSGIVIPGQNIQDMIDISVAIDVSGSITDEMLKDFLGEVKGIMEQYHDFKLRLWCFDAKVYNDVTFTPDTLNEIYNYKIDGGGGTLFECNWEYMKNNDIEPHKFIMFTDGHPNNSWGDELYCDTLFIIHGNKSIKAPFGMTCYYE